MLKHILTGQPSSAGSRHHNDYQTQSQQAHQQTPVGSLQTTIVGPGSLHHHHHPGHTHPEHHHHQHFTAGSPSNRMHGGTRLVGTSGNNNNNSSISITNGTSNNNINSSDVYDSVVHPSQRLGGGGGGGGIYNGQSHQPTPSSTHRHPLNHSQLSVNNLSQRLNNSHALNLSTLSTSKHSVNSASPVVGNNNNHNINNNVNGNNSGVHHTLTLIPQVAHERERSQANGGLDISRFSRLPSQATPSPAPAPVHAPVSQVVQAPGTGGPGLLQLNASWSSTISKNNKTTGLPGQQQETGVKEMLTFLGLLCLVSLLLAMLSHIFLLKISPLTVTPSSLISPEEYTIVYEVTLALCALALSLNLCCLLVCAIQFLFAVKLVKSSYQGHRTNKYLQKSSISRICAVGGFFVSIPVFLTGMILYTFIQFHSTPAIVMSVFIGLGIVFCGCAMVHNVFVWQREKTNAVKALARAQCEAAAQMQRQQQLQQHQQSGGRGVGVTMHRGGCVVGVPKIASLTGGNSTTTLQNARGTTLAYQQQQLHLQQQQQQQQQHHLQQQQQQQQQQLQQQHHHHHHQHRHIQMSPPLLLSSPNAGIAATHNHTGVVIGPNGRILSTPPTTPGDRSPPSPNNLNMNNLNNNNSSSGSSKHNRHLQRETSGSISPGLPQATLDLSSAATTNSPHELSTLV